MNPLKSGGECRCSGEQFLLH